MEKNTHVIEIYRQDIQTHLNLPSTVTQKSHDWKPIPACGPKSDWTVLKIAAPHPLQITGKKNAI